MARRVDTDDGMMKLFAKRSRLIARGHFHAKPPLYKGTPVGELRERRRHNFQREAERVATLQANMDRSDPFLFGRIMTALDAGVYTPSEIPENRRISV